MFWIGAMVLKHQTALSFRRLKRMDGCRYLGVLEGAGIMVQKMIDDDRDCSEGVSYPSVHKGTNPR